MVDSTQQQSLAPAHPFAKKVSSEQVPDTNIENENDGVKATTMTIGHALSQNSDQERNFNSTNYTSQLSSLQQQQQYLGNNPVKNTRFSVMTSDQQSVGVSNAQLSHLDEADSNLERDVTENSQDNETLKMLDMTLKKKQEGASDFQNQLGGGVQKRKAHQGALGMTAGPRHGMKIQVSLNFDEPKLNSQASHPAELGLGQPNTEAAAADYYDTVCKNNNQIAAPDNQINVTELKSNQSLQMQSQPGKESNQGAGNNFFATAGAESMKKKQNDQQLLDSLSMDLVKPIARLQRERPPQQVMSMEELIAVSQPLRGPGFDPEQHIEEWSDDSSDEENCREKTDEEMLDELLNGAGPMPQGGVPLRRTVAAIYMPIRVNCLYG